MKTTEKNISALIESQFPSFYQEEGPLFVAFVKAYYEWMEQPGNVLYESRRLSEYKDIDTTLDKFILYFKEKYLKNIQFDTATNKKLLIKNSLDLYRSKGTERSADLFFNLVYGTDSEVKYPREKIFKLSDGVWEKPLYLEVTPTDRNIDYVGKKVVGTQSGAEAFIEKFIRRKTDSGFVNVFYISSITGEFAKGETLGISLSGVTTTYSDSPRLIGSLQEILIQDGSSNFKIGDLVNITSTNGATGGIARVTSTVDATGAVDFIFLDGGWGYTNSSSYAIISDKVLVLSAVTATPESKAYFDYFEKFTEPMATLAVDNIIDGFISVGDTFTRTTSDGVVAVNGKVLASNISSGTGTVTVSIANGTLVASGNTYVTSSGVQFDATAVTDFTTQAEVMGVPTSFVLEIHEQNGTVSVGDIIYQVDSINKFAQGTVTNIETTVSGTTIVTLENAYGAFKNSFSSYVISNTSYQINANTNINNGTYFISVNDNRYNDGDVVVYRTDVANSAISGLSNNESYFVVSANTSGFKVSQTTGGEPIPLIAATSVTSNGHHFDQANRNVPVVRVAANSTNIDTALNFIKIPGNPFKFGDAIHYTTSTGNTAITGMANNRTYYVVQSNTSGIKLSERYNGSVAIISSGLDETGHNLVGKLRIGLTSSSGVENSNYVADFVSMNLNVGLYNLSKSIYNLAIADTSSNSSYNNANSIFNSEYIYSYDESNKVIAKGRVITGTLTGNSGLLTIEPLSGYFVEGRKVYTSSNAASATISGYSVDVRGGDFIRSNHSMIRGLTNGTTATIDRISQGYGAQFDIGSIGNKESIYINTDLLASNTNQYINDEKKSLTIASNPGFVIGDIVYQTYSANVTSNSTNINSVSGFIKTDLANLYSNGDLVEYNTITTPIERYVYPFGNTALAYTTQVANGTQFFVSAANTTGFKLTETREGNTFVIFAPQTPGSNNHSFVKVVGAGTVIESNPTELVINDVYKQFGVTAGKYSNVANYSNPSISAAISSIGIKPTTITPELQYPIEKIRAVAYGFPKNPQGDLNSTIFSCLTFDKFDIGTIAGISGIDPGSNYDIDPFVLIYQPYIAQFNKKDYKFTVSDTSGNFIPGERITQTPVSLTYYDLEVSAGVKDTTYNTILKNFDPRIDIDDANNFMLVPYNTVSIEANVAVDHKVASFNSLYDVDAVQNFIQIANNPFIDGDELTYRSTVSPLGGLANNGVYYALNSNTSGLQLGANSTTVIPIDIERTVNSYTHKLYKNINNYISVSGNQFTNNMVVRYYTDGAHAEISGLANNTLYSVVNASSFGFMLANTANTNQIMEVVPSSNSDVAHFIRSYYNGANNDSLIFDDGNAILYNEYYGGSNIGLANNTSYFVVSANTIGFKFATSFNGAPIDIGNSSITTSEPGHFFSTLPGYLRGDVVYQDVTKSFNGSTAVNESTDFIIIANNPYANGDSVLYYTSTGNTAIIGNNQYYTVAGANTSGIKLANSSGSIQDLTKSPTSETGHFIKSVPTGFVSLVYTVGSNGYVRVSNTTQTFATNFALKSNTYPIFEEGQVLSVNVYSEFATAQGIIKDVANSSSFTVKRIEFENTFIPGETVSGTLSGATATLIAASEDGDSMSIGVNATVDANVVITNGTIKTLQVVDSGLAYANSEIVQYYSEDGSRSGTGKAIIDGHGISKGYYKSSKGFLSADMKVHDGDYYQEYSYEILSRISFDRYSDMYKKVMHVAGTKLFGSTAIDENVNISGDVVNIQADQEVEFNPKTDIDPALSAIDVGIPTNTRNFIPLRIENSSAIYMRNNPFMDGDIVRYSTDTNNVADFGLANNSNYYVVNTNGDYLSLSTTDGGNPVQLTKQSNIQFGHFLTSYVNPFKVGDLVQYYPQYRTFNKSTDVVPETDFINIEDNIFKLHSIVTYKKANSSVIELNGLVDNTQYAVISSNTSGIKLGNGVKEVSSVFKYDANSKDVTIYLVNSETYSNVDISTASYGGLTTIEYNTSGGQFELISTQYNILANNYGISVTNLSTGEVEINTTYNQVGDSVGNVNVIMVGTQFFKKTLGVNNTRYSFIEDKLTVEVPETIVTNYYIVDDLSTNILPTEDSGKEIDLLIPVVDFGLANIDFTENFVNIRNLNLTSNQPLFVNGDIIEYRASYRNIPILDLFDGAQYFVVSSNSSGFKVSQTQNGSPIDISLLSETIDPIRDISDQYDFIIIRDNQFSIDDPLVYTTNTGYRAISGLSNNGLYYVSYANSVGIKVSTELRGDPLSINVAPTYITSFDGYANVDNASDFIAIPSHSFANGDAVVYYANTRITPIVGLANNNLYTIISANTSGVKLSIDGSTPVNITATKTRSVSFNATTDVASGSDFITMTHSFITNELIKYYTDTSVNPITGLANNTNYYVAAANSSGIKLSLTSGGVPIDITAPAGGGLSYVETVTANAHYIISANTAATSHFTRQLSANGYKFTTINNDDGSGHILYRTTPTNNFEYNSQFYVVESDSKTIKLSNTIGGDAISLIADKDETGHYLKKIVEE